MRRYIAALILAVLYPWPCVWAANVSDFVDFSLRAADNSLLLPGRLYVPSVAATSARPLILFMHGAGEVGTNNVSQINANLDNLLAEAKVRGAFLLAPQTYTSWADTTITTLTATMIDRALSSQHVDVNRIYVTGLSLGGGGVWNMLNRYPTRFAASVPIAAVAPASDFVSSRLVNEPIWAFHARDDATVSVTASRNVVTNILRAAGKPVPTYPALSDRTTTFQLDTSSTDYLEYPTGGHGIWPAVYSYPPMYNWMFGHSSSPVPNNFLLTPVVGGNFYQWNTGFVSPNDAQIAARVVGPNLAIGATPFANGAIPGFPATNINNGLADGSDTWMGVDDTTDDFVGLAFSSPISLGAFTIEGRFPDRSTGLYTFQYTTVANPNASTPDASWIAFGEYTATPGGVAFPALDKTLFAVAPIANVTGFRIVTHCTWPNYPIGMNIAEVEVYSAAVPEPSLLALVLTAGAILSLPRPRRAASWHIQLQCT